MTRLRALQVFASIALFSDAALANESSTTATPGRVVVVPTSVPPSCKQEIEQRQVLFDLCRDQLSLLHEAQQKAKKTGKLVLVSFGADWCIWCHVFEAHILGKFGRYSYFTNDGPWIMDEKLKGQNLIEAKAQSSALSAYVAEQFVIVNIGQQSADGGGAVLKDTQADAHFSGALPFIFALDESGKFSDSIKSSDVEIRRDGRNAYRGYDRIKLLTVLQTLSAKSRSQKGALVPKPIQ